MKSLPQHPAIAKLLAFVANITEAGAPENVAQSVLSAGLKALAKTAETEIGDTLPPTLWDQQTGDYRLN